MTASVTYINGWKREEGEILGNTADPLQNEQANLGVVQPICQIFRHASPGTAVLDPGGRVNDCNPAFAAIVGQTPSEVLQRELLSFVHPHDRERFQGELHSLLAGETPAFVAEVRYARRDHTTVVVRNSVSLVRDKSGQPAQIVCLLEDITLLRLAEQALIQNEKLAAVGRLSASIAHEMNNPLESIVNLLFLISNSHDLTEMQKFANLAQQEMKRVAQISTQTLRFYRQQAVPAPLQLTEVIDSVLVLFEGRLRNRNVQVIKRYLDGSQPAIAHSGELRQVFVNLIANALDAMDDRGTLRIDVRPSRSWLDPEVCGVRVIVCDSGSGIPHSLLKKVFEPFVSTKENHGTGLGLWISNEIIRRHGGFLRVRSAVEGSRRGTAMSVFLPTPPAPNRVGLAA
jgi:PAS domain S-box-containing protein